MKCPYCVEEIKDEALVCRYCHQNLMVFKSLNDRMTQLEDQFAEMITAFNNLPLNVATTPLETQSAALVPETNQTASRYRYASSFLLPLLASLGLYWLARSTPMPLYGWSRIIFAISIVCPLPFGLWRGLALRGTHLKSYVIIGLSVGFFNAIGTIVIYSIDAGITPSPSDLLYALTYYFPTGALLYTAGGLIGDWVEKKRAPAVEAGYAVRLAKKIVGKKRGSPEGISKVKRLTDIITALAPLLTFLGSIIAAYLSYKATISKSN